MRKEYVYDEVSAGSSEPLICHVPDPNAPMTFLNANVSYANTKNHTVTMASLQKILDETDKDVKLYVFHSETERMRVFQKWAQQQPAVPRSTPFGAGAFQYNPLDDMLVFPELVESGKIICFSGRENCKMIREAILKRSVDNLPEGSTIDL